MNAFPTTFTDVYYLDLSVAVGAEQTALRSLAEKGFVVQLGLAPEDVPALQALSIQTSVLKYCPKDCTERFKDLPTIQKWLEKERLAFLLKEQSTGALAGVAWTGPGTSPHIAGGKLTGGVRLSEDFQGLGLATPFLSVVLEHTKAYYSSDQMWFECWQSNAGAVHIYQKLGFEIVQTEPSHRPTPEGTTPDVRLYMKLIS